MILYANYVAKHNTRTIDTLLSNYGLTLQIVADGSPIPYSWFGDSEAGLLQNQLFIRADTPIHSLLHELSHYVCMDQERRSSLCTNAGGDDFEENAVCFLEIILADQLPYIGKSRILADMQQWGYSFRLGTPLRWFVADAETEKEWLIAKQIITPQLQPTWKIRI